MARSKSDTVDYFPHPCKDGDRMAYMESVFGLQGYAAYYKLLARLGRSEGHYLDFSDAQIRSFYQGDIKATDETLDLIMKAFCDLKVIDRDLWYEHRVVWCQEFVDKLVELYSKRGRKPPTKPINRPGNNITDMLIGPEIHQSKVKESKEEESKLKETEFFEDDDNSRNGICFYKSDKLCEEMINTQWLERIGMRFGYAPEAIKKRFGEWAKDQEDSTGLGRALGELKKHFFNTIRKESKNDTTKKNIGHTFKPGGAGRF
jgi:hypothetical protein